MSIQFRAPIVRFGSKLHIAYLTFYHYFNEFFGYDTVKWHVGAVQLALTKKLRKLKRAPVATAVNQVMANQYSSAISKIPRFIANADFRKKPYSLDECVSILIHYKLPSEVYRNITHNINEKVKGLNWELEKFRVIKIFFFWVL